MTPDWSLWPYRLAAAQGEVAFRMYVMGRDLEAANRELAARLYPAIRPVVKELRNLAALLREDGT